MSKVKVVEYQWKPGSAHRVAPEVAAQVFNEVRERDGDVTPAGVLDASRDQSAPLHDEFDWCDKTAAERYRQHQARKMIGSLVVVYRHSSSAESTPTRAYVSVRQLAVAGGADVETGDDPTHRFKHVSEVLEDARLRRAYLLVALREIGSWRRKYQDIRELAGLHRAVDGVIVEHGDDRLRAMIAPREAS